MPSSALAIAISRALTRPSRARRARRRSSSEPMSSRIANADIVGSPPPDHYICYSRSPFDATLLASQHQFRSVLLDQFGLAWGRFDRSLFERKGELVSVRLTCHPNDSAPCQAP